MVDANDSRSFEQLLISVQVRFWVPILQLIKFCPRCGKKLPKRLRDEFFNTLKKVYSIETDIGECRERFDFPIGLKVMSDGKTRFLNKQIENKKIYLTVRDLHYCSRFDKDVFLNG